MEHRHPSVISPTGTPQIKGMLVFALTVLMLLGCAPAARRLTVESLSQGFLPGTIVDTRSRQPIDFAAFITALEQVAIVYVGESHMDPAHHDVQRRVIEALADRRPGLAVGLEMFDRTYQPILDQWGRGLLDENALLEKSHWYANWRYPYPLYRELMETIRTRGLRPVALNLPFHIPPKIAAGGLDSLFGDDRKHLPLRLDTTNAQHRAFVARIFQQHRSIGNINFEKFYQAQCAWEEAMAEAVAEGAGNSPMVVLAGSGHIIEKFGIPLRAFARNGAAYLTVLPVSAGGTAQLTEADFLWVTPARPKLIPMHKGG
ncbi:MAG: ChaN family lipoprotein [Desulfobacterales bacterium]|nr:ChaN family lipoprotein [Desulfobacterales bacterium]